MSSVQESLLLTAQFHTLSEAMVDQHTTLLLRALQYPSAGPEKPGLTQEFRHLVAWLEDNQVRLPYSGLLLSSLACASDEVLVLGFAVSVKPETAGSHRIKPQIAFADQAAQTTRQEWTCGNT